jgi:hypothetical protein
MKMGACFFGQKFADDLIRTMYNIIMEHADFSRFNPFHQSYHDLEVIETENSSKVTQNTPDNCI